MINAQKLIDILNNLERYLLQQEDLFGNIIYKEPEKEDHKWETVNSLDEFNFKILSCQKCSLGATRKNFVFGVGNPKAEIMLIGEAPGADEDEQGEPFVGRAGQLLNNILKAVSIERSEVYICNILKCRPPNNRDPLVSEMEQCTPYLEKQIDLIKPKFIICLGRIAAQWLLKTNDGLNKLRQQVFQYKGASLIVTYHPAALLRNESWKRPTWEDMKLFKKLYDEYKNNSK